jgi:hypothetical protein
MNHNTSLMRTKILILAIFLLPGLIGCVIRVHSGPSESDFEVGPSQIPQPTYTPNPTYTPRPTYTPLPTYTPRPTYTPLPKPTADQSTPISGESPVVQCPERRPPALSTL